MAPYFGVVDSGIGDLSENTGVKFAEGMEGETTWPCLTEAMYLIGRVRQAGAHDAVWDLIAQGFLSRVSLQGHGLVRRDSLTTPPAAPASSP